MAKADWRDLQLLFIIHDLGGEATAYMVAKKLGYDGESLRSYGRLSVQKRLDKLVELGFLEARKTNGKTLYKLKDLICIDGLVLQAKKIGDKTVFVIYKCDKKDCPLRGSFGDAANCPKLRELILGKRQPQ